MICWASSRVGASTSARTDRGPGRRGFSSICATRGTPKAAVLPVPVWASPITSRPFMACGIACFWIGVGSVIPISLSRATSFGGRPIISKSLISYLSGADQRPHTFRRGACRARRVTPKGSQVKGNTPQHLSIGVWPHA